MSAKVAGIGWVGLLAAVLADVPKLPGRLCRGRWELFDAEGKRASPTPACAGNAQSLGRVENGPTDGADSRAWWPVCTDMGGVLSSGQGEAAAATVVVAAASC